MGNMYRVAVVPGDGTGPEVTEQAVRVLDTAAEMGGCGSNRRASWPRRRT